MSYYFNSFTLIVRSGHTSAITHGFMQQAMRMIAELNTHGPGPVVTSYKRDGRELEITVIDNSFNILKVIKKYANNFQDTREPFFADGNNCGDGFFWQIANGKIETTIAVVVPQEDGWTKLT